MDVARLAEMTSDIMTVARWVPSVDVNRIVAGGQLVGLVAILLVRLIVRQRAA